MSELVPGMLCYVSGWAAYFTTNLKDQWGDDWNDAPYEHNAGRPYKKEGVTLTRVFWDGPFVAPDHNTNNSPYSVEMINRGETPWLKPFGVDAGSIWAGASFSEFSRIIHSAGGTVYAPITSTRAAAFKEAAEVVITEPDLPHIAVINGVPTAVESHPTSVRVTEGEGFGWRQYGDEMCLRCAIGKWKEAVAQKITRMAEASAQEETK